MWRLLSLISLALLVVPARGQDKSAKVTLEVVKYEGLQSVVTRHRGKVVFVEFWADWCKICKEKHFPHIAKLHDRFADQGLVVVTVALPEEDQPAAEVKDSVYRFLKKVNAPFTNLLLDEKDDVWQTRLKFVGPPHTIIFDRQGKWTAFTARESSTNPAALDLHVEKALAARKE